MRACVVLYRAYTPSKGSERNAHERPAKPDRNAKVERPRTE